MKEIEFKAWMLEHGKNKKVVGDTISRLKRIEKEIGPCDIDKEYRKDQCEYLFRIFANNGKNDEMDKYSANSSFPIGKYYISTYRHALKQYLEFCDKNLG